jgi:hypothetical protein
VKATGGKVLGHGERVRVTGKVTCKKLFEPALPCQMNVDRIDLP